MGSIFFLFKGKNIFISDNIEEILAFVDEQTQGYVVQKYIENPLLLDNNRKFDIRWEEVLINFFIHLMNLNFCHQNPAKLSFLKMVCHEAQLSGSSRVCCCVEYNGRSFKACMTNKPSQRSRWLWNASFYTYPSSDFEVYPTRRWLSVVLI